MDDETPVREALAAIGVSGKKVTGLPDEFHTFSDIEVTADFENGYIDMEYEDSAGGYHRRSFKVDHEAMRNEDTDTIILVPERRCGDPFVDFFEEHGPFEVRK